jgi:tetratricopeptide (TPR) repeat protein
MQQQKQSAFYDEVLRALWGYVGDKLNIPVTELSHDNIADRLAAQQVEQETIDKFIQALDECEYERYAPGDPAGNMNKTFDYAMTAITRIEDSMKAAKSRRRPSARLLFVALALASLFLPAEFVNCGYAATTEAHAALKASADSAYAKGDYQQAIRDYEALLKQGESAELYYNLGNAYYRTDNITRAVINYERAQLLKPADRDIRFNLQMARTKVIDKITPVSEMFFVTWYRSLVNLNNIDGWAHIAVVSIILALILALVYLFASAVFLRKIGFIGGIVFLVLFLLSNLFAFQQRRILMNRTGAVIIAPSVTVKKTPAANATDQGVLHEGTRVDIIDDTMTDWKEIRIADGNEGWVQTSQIEKI